MNPADALELAVYHYLRRASEDGADGESLQHELRLAAQTYTAAKVVAQLDDAADPEVAERHGAFRHEGAIVATDTGVNYFGSGA